MAVGTSNTNSGNRALRMTVNVRETLLNDPENGGLRILRETPQILWQLQIDFDLGAFCKPIQVRPQSRGEPNIVEQRRYTTMDKTAIAKTQTLSPTGRAWRGSPVSQATDLPLSPSPLRYGEGRPSAVCQRRTSQSGPLPGLGLFCLIGLLQKGELLFCEPPKLVHALLLRALVFVRPSNLASRASI